MPTVEQESVAGGSPRPANSEALLALGGTAVAALPIFDLEWVRDLEYHDGPLLSLFKHKRHGDTYLYYWCDCDDSVNRWMILRVSESNLTKLVDRLIPLDQIIPQGCQDDFVYLVDLDSDGGFKAVWLLALDSIPEQYTPGPSVFLNAAAG